MRLKIPKPGPGALITAAFIGPGTITTCTMAGANFGFALLWGLVFSIVATIVLQEMAARLGIITGQGLGEALKGQFNRGIPRVMALVLVISAITIGNAAFETGNILGATLGIESIAGQYGKSNSIWVSLIGITAFVLLFTGSYKVIEKVMIALVILMSITFITTAIMVAPPFGEILKGMFLPSLPSGSMLTLVGLIGTTVVPYNLFLYASTVRERFTGSDSLPAARADMATSIILGGVISIAVVVTASMAFFGAGETPSHAGHLASQLQPLWGSSSRYFVGIGLFAAGISSAITAPLAAAYATAGLLGWERDLRAWRFRLVWIAILLTGTVLSLLGLRPLEAIVFAQAANGILLPVIAIYLLWVVNSPRIMGNHTNKALSNFLGIGVILIALVLGITTLLRIFGLL